MLVSVGLLEIILIESQDKGLTYISDFGIVVERSPHNREVVGSYPTRCWAIFSYLSSL